ncbi:MAG: hypothetical protein AAFQ41_13585 [Cyanobacteria bacterium J06623_7]
MSESHNKLPIGMLLQHAGLISNEQLHKALELQAQYTQMKLGEILVLQEGLRVKTIDFFVDKWQEIIDRGQIFPLGYYLKEACLLNEKQVEVILQEQKVSQQKFGELAVQKGWVARNTIDFFLDNLSSQPQQVMSLRQLEEYDRNVLNLAKKYANHTLILSRILGWTGGVPTLTKTIGQTFAQSNSNIPPGREIQAVDRFVEGTLIRKWQTSKAAAAIRALKYSLLNNSRCEPGGLLTEYQDILLAGEAPNLGTKEQKELLLLGLVVSDGDRLKVSNIIYQQVFDHEFVLAQLAELQPQDIVPAIKPMVDDVTTLVPGNSLVEYAPPTSIQTLPVPTALDDAVAQADTIDESSATVIPSNSPEPLTKIGSIIICTAIALLIPLFLTINNYYSSRLQPGVAVDETEPEISDLQQSCEQISFTDANGIVSSISNLEAQQKQLNNNFPERCIATLDQLRVIAAPQLGKENRILEAIRHLCNVSPDSEVVVDAEVWLKRWYSSADWGAETKFYLQERAEHYPQDCPAAHFTENEA